MASRTNTRSAPRAVSIGRVRIGGSQPLVLIAGPCVIESEAHALGMARRLVKIASAAKVPLVFKASYDKANRSSISSYRGPGLAAGLAVLRKIKDRFGVPILTDIHEPAQAAAAAEVCDVLQIPAFLSRQTDLLVAAGRSGPRGEPEERPIPFAVGNGQRRGESREHREPQIFLTERGVSFGYHNLVVDMRSFPILAKTGCPVVFDVTHSVQLPGGQGTPAAASLNLSSRWRARAAPPAWTAFFWKYTKVRGEPFRTGRMLCRSTVAALLGKLPRSSKLVRSWSPR